MTSTHRSSSREKPGAAQGDFPSRDVELMPPSKAQFPPEKQF